MCVIRLTCSISIREQCYIHNHAVHHTIYQYHPLYMSLCTSAVKDSICLLSRVLTRPSPCSSQPHANFTKKVIWRLFYFLDKKLPPKKSKSFFRLLDPFTLLSHPFPSVSIRSSCPPSNFAKRVFHPYFSGGKSQSRNVRFFLVPRPSSCCSSVEPRLPYTRRS